MLKRGDFRVESSCWPKSTDAGCSMDVVLDELSQQQQDEFPFITVEVWSIMA